MSAGTAVYREAWKVRNLFLCARHAGGSSHTARSSALSWTNGWTRRRSWHAGSWGPSDTTSSTDIAILVSWKWQFEINSPLPERQKSGRTPDEEHNREPGCREVDAMATRRSIRHTSSCVRPGYALSAGIRGHVPVARTHRHEHLSNAADRGDEAANILADVVVKKT